MKFYTNLNKFHGHHSSQIFKWIQLLSIFLLKWTDQCTELHFCMVHKLHQLSKLEICWTLQTSMLLRLAISIARLFTLQQSMQIIQIILWVLLLISVNCWIIRCMMLISLLRIVIQFILICWPIKIFRWWRSWHNQSFMEFLRIMTLDRILEFR